MNGVCVCNVYVLSTCRNRTQHCWVWCITVYHYVHKRKSLFFFLSEKRLPFSSFLWFVRLRHIFFHSWHCFAIPSSSSSLFHCCYQTLWHHKTKEPKTNNKTISISAQRILATNARTPWFIMLKCVLCVSESIWYGKRKLRNHKNALAKKLISIFTVNVLPFHFHCLSFLLLLLFSSYRRKSRVYVRQIYILFSVYVRCVVVWRYGNSCLDCVKFHEEEEQKNVNIEHLDDGAAPQL